MKQPGFYLEISFCKSKSKKYRTALKRARALPTYRTIISNSTERHTATFGTLGEFCNYREAVEALTIVIFRWVSASVLLNGEEIGAEGIGSICNEIEQMRRKAKAKYIGFDKDGTVIYVLPELEEFYNRDDPEEPVRDSNILYLEDYVVSDI